MCFWDAALHNDYDKIKIHNALICVLQDLSNNPRILCFLCQKLKNRMHLLYCRIVHSAAFAPPQRIFFTPQMFEQMIRPCGRTSRSKKNVRRNVLFIYTCHVHV